MKDTLSFKTDNSNDLEDIITNLSEQYYLQMSEIAKSMELQVNSIKIIDTQNSATTILELCNLLCADIRAYLKLRDQEFIPYIVNFVNTRSHDHDCSTCKGNCKLKHADQLAAILESHIKVKNALQVVQTLLSSENEPVLYPDAYRILQSQLTLIESTLTNIFLLEETYIKPQLLSPHKN